MFAPAAFGLLMDAGGRLRMDVADNLLDLIGRWKSKQRVK
jgi:hypothetical protein